MTIGELLKKYRLNMGLTLEEMSADIVSTSFYSKVEKGQHRISAEDFFDILNVHSISLATFLNEWTEEGDKLDITQQKILKYYYDEDIEAIKSILERLNNDTKQEQMTISLATSCLYNLDDTFIISEDNIRLIKEIIFSLPNWNYFKLSLYTNFISFYDLETNHLIIRSILSKDMSEYRSNEQTAIITILLNFVDDLIDNDELTDADFYLQKVDEILTPLPELLFYHTLKNYYGNFIQYLKTQDSFYLQKCEATIHFFEANGYETYADRLKKDIQKTTIN